jgi:hypothetical protein
MAKENTSYWNHYIENAGLDAWLEAIALLSPTNEWWHQLAVAAEQANLRGRWNKVVNKTTNPASIDAGPSNMQIGTAILLLERYKASYPNDPLGLSEYFNDYSKLVRDLTGRPPYCGDKATKLTVALFGLMVSEAETFFLNNADPYYWQVQLTQVERDAILVTYCVLGERQIKANCKAAQDAGEPYQPGIGQDDAGGENHKFNACRIGKAMLNPNYGGCGLPKCTELDPNTCQSRMIDCFPPGPGRLWDRALTAGPAPDDPLVLDLDGDGIQTTNVTAGAYFDHTGDGFAEQTGWVDPDDGLLVMDRNGNGIIDDGKELFGDRTILKNGQRASNGFEALAELDSNKDGKIDATDAAFPQLRIWKDIGEDGVSTPLELYTLDELGIKAINLDSTITHVAPDAQGNTQTRIGSFEKIDGTTGQIAEYNLQRDTMHSIPSQYFDVPDDIAALPDLQGAGNVYDLQQAMAMDTSGQLKSLVEQFAATSDISGRDALMQQILFKWTGSDGIDPNSRGPNIDARKLGVLEKFFGQSFFSRVQFSGPNPNFWAALDLTESYRQIFETNYAELMAQTHLEDLYAKVGFTWDEAKQVFKTDLSGVITDTTDFLALAA